MNIERLQDFAKKLETVKSEKFDLASYVSIKKYNEKLDKPISELVQFDCETTACAVGYLPVFYPETFKYVSQCSIGYVEDGWCSYQDSAHYFCLNELQWDLLFEQQMYSDFNQSTKDPKKVIERIELLIEHNGNVGKVIECLETK